MTPNEDTDTDHSDSRAQSCIKLNSSIGIVVITLLVAILILGVFIAILVGIDAAHNGR